MDAPYLYNYLNAYSCPISPNNLQIRNNNMYQYFQKYLMQKALSVFEWHLPKHWDKFYFLYTLYGEGKIGIIHTDKFGVIPQRCSLSGFNVFYQPSMIVFANPLIRASKPLMIGRDCVLMRLQPDYSGIRDLVEYNAGMLALMASAMMANIIGAKTANIFLCTNQAVAETYKKMVDKINAGEPAIFADRRAFDEDDGSPNLIQYNSELKNNFIVPALQEAMRRQEAEFDTEIGIPNANTDKKERLITDEVNANNFETLSRPLLWLESLQKACDEINTLYGQYLTDKVSVSFNKKLLQEVRENELSDFPDGNLQSGQNHL